MPRHAQVAPAELVGWTASQISDPVLRLRFLKTVAPRVKPRTAPHHLKKLIALLLALVGFSAPWCLRSGSPAPPVMAPVRIPTAPDPPKPGVVWQVESAESYDTYSNGLRIENQYAVNNRPRAYSPVLRTTALNEEPLRTNPVGIVFHTTESLQAPFEPSQNSVLKRAAESLLDYVRRKRAYNFLIDRFGRVYRIVREEDAANHAGHSVWADESALYIGLNDSFLGVSFEARTDSPEINPAQVRSAAMLTEMLRGRYNISAANCVTHAQVSVNPDNFQIGYHTDWASNFPFERLGLPDNYARPLPSVLDFGFSYDSAFARRAGPRLASAAALAVAQLRDQCGSSHQSVSDYTRCLRDRYRRAGKHAAAAE